MNKKILLQLLIVFIIILLSLAFFFEFLKKDEEKGGKMTKKVTEMKKDPVPSMKPDSMLYKKGCISGGSKNKFKS